MDAWCRTNKISKTVRMACKTGDPKLALKNGERVELRGFATFSIRKQKSRKSRNPKTGESVQVPEKNSIYFKMTKDLFNKINNND